MLRRPAVAATLVSLAFAALLSAGPAAAFWTLPAENLSAPDRDGDEPQVAVGPDGVATVVWQSSGTTDAIVQASRLADGAWSNPPADVSESGETAYEPRLAVGPDGAVTAVWYDAINTVRAARYTDGTWSDPVPLSIPAENAQQPRVAAGPDGTAVALWYRSDGGATIRAARFSGGAWGTRETISDAVEPSSSPRVAVGPDGTATAVWIGFDGANNLVWASRLPVGGAWTTPEPLSDPGRNAAEPQVAVGPDGVPTAIWIRSDGTNTIVQASRRSATGWSDPDDLSLAGRNAYLPQVAAGADGSVVATWVRSNIDNETIQARRLSGAVWGPAADVSPTGPDAGEPQVAVGPDGTATIVWESLGGAPGAKKIVRAARSTGETWSGPEDLSDDGQDASYPKVAVGPDGATVATWSRPDGTKKRIQAARFIVAPPAPGGVTAVAGDTRATVSWQAPALDGGSPITGYTVTAAPGGQTCVTTGVTTCTVEGLANGVAHTFTVRATNAAGTGQPSPASDPVTPQPAPLGTPPADTTAPVISALSVTPRRAVRGIPRQTTRQLLIRFRLSEAASVRMQVQRRAPGLRRGRACVAPTRALRLAGARACPRFLAVAVLTRRDAAAGANRVVISRLRVGRRTLLPGTYRLQVQATDAAGNRSVVRTTALAVVPAPRRR